MEYRTWPALDARVSLLGFGCMRFPTDDAGCVQEDAAAAMEPFRVRGAFLTELARQTLTRSV